MHLYSVISFQVNSPPSDIFMCSTSIFCYSLSNYALLHFMGSQDALGNVSNMISHDKQCEGFIFSCIVCGQRVLGQPRTMCQKFPHTSKAIIDYSYLFSLPLLPSSPLSSPSPLPTPSPTLTSQGHWARLPQQTTSKIGRSCPGN